MAFKATFPSPSSSRINLFGTLCAIDPRPARLNKPELIGMFRLFSELIAKHIDSERKLAAVESDLNEEREVSELREQFIAVLAHELRTPVRAVNCFAAPIKISVNVKATTSANGFELSVSNSGDPIPASALDRLFQPFYRSAELQNRQGLGLGLYVANEIAKPMAAN